MSERRDAFAARGDGGEAPAAGPAPRRPEGGDAEGRGSSSSSRKGVGSAVSHSARRGTAIVVRDAMAQGPLAAPRAVLPRSGPPGRGCRRRRGPSQGHLRHGPRRNRSHAPRPRPRLRQSPAPSEEGPPCRPPVEGPRRGTCGMVLEETAHTLRVLDRASDKVRRLPKKGLLVALLFQEPGPGLSADCLLLHGDALIDRQRTKTTPASTTLRPATKWEPPSTSPFASLLLSTPSTAAAKGTTAKIKTR
mmetsp:Transcript_32245/g.102817  ORF Transcript_32245/g.102817 Transcript_32245/m.102817 type:complete len:248 (+) Transcript_32245:193-936(+)